MTVRPFDPIGEAVRICRAGGNLTARAAAAAIGVILDGQADHTLAAAFLTVIHERGETAAMLAGAVAAVRARMVAFDPTDADGRRLQVLDTCGTGGDGAHTVNISTAAAIVVAACGVPVVKHGNRAASSSSGSADVLTELGVDIDAPPATLEHCLRNVGITFLFAPKFHHGLRHAAPIRKQLPFRTIFNLVGPLVNPARPAYQLIGTTSDAAAKLIAGALEEMTERPLSAAVVSNSEGVDEILPAGTTRVRWVGDGLDRNEEWRPDQFGGRSDLERDGWRGLEPSAADPVDLRVASPRESADRIRALFEGERGALRSIVIANAGAALYAAGVAPSLLEGCQSAKEAIDSGAAAKLPAAWARLSREHPTPLD